MSQPIISWTDEFGEDLPSSKLDFGIVDAGDVGDDFSVLVWNNKGGTDIVSDIIDCTIATKDISGGNGSNPSLNVASREIIENKWVEVRLKNSLVYTPIGGTTTIAIESEENPINEETGLPITNIISGAPNSGDALVDKFNYAKLIFRANIPEDASSGVIDFLTRVSYRYI